MELECQEEEEEERTKGILQCEVRLLSCAQGYFQGASSTRFNRDALPIYTALKRKLQDRRHLLFAVLLESEVPYWAYTLQGEERLQ